MENHPIPQDVTGFQFKLIGDMTVKQFAYLAGGIFLAWVCYMLPVSFLIRFPFIALFGALGVCLAFVPVEGRPFDVMATNFFTSLFSPTQFVYQKVGGHIAIFALQTQPVSATTTLPITHADKLEAFLQTTGMQPKNKLDEKELSFFQNLGLQPLQHVSQPKPTAPITSVGPPAPPPQQVGTPQPAAPDPHNPTVLIQQEQQLESQEHAVETQLEQAKTEEEKSILPEQKTQAHHHSAELEAQLQQILSQKAMLETQLQILSQRLQDQRTQATLPTTQTQPQQAPPPVQPPPAVQTPPAQPQSAPVPPIEAVLQAIPQPTSEKRASAPARSIPLGMGTKTGMPIAPDAPNVISGIVKDARGNILPNMLVEVKDAENNPIRAFKTNTLGQFASATALSNGIYTIAFEDPQGKQKFNDMTLAVNGQIIQPLEVISTDERELLRKDLFGK